jgi:hypothetical protein
MRPAKWRDYPKTGRLEIKLDSDYRPPEGVEQADRSAAP